MNQAYETRFINITNIMNNPSNFRHIKLATSAEALQELLRDPKSGKNNVLELAEDIVELQMMDPSVKMMVKSDAKNRRQYIVLEGNRRIAALKTMINPELS